MVRVTLDNLITFRFLSSTANVLVEFDEDPLADETPLQNESPKEQKSMQSGNEGDNFSFII